MQLISGKRIRLGAELITATLLLCCACAATAQTLVSPLRRPINSGNPLFVYSSVYHGADTAQLTNFWKVLPEDVKPYFGVHVNPRKSDSPQTRAWIESVLDAAQSLGIPAIIEAEGFNSQNDTPMEYWAGLFEKFPNLIGLNISEISATGGLTGANLDAAFMDKMARYIEVAASHGGYFIWQDMSWDAPFPKSPHLFVKAGAEPALFKAIRDNGAHVIFTHKHNGSGRRFTSDAAAMGFWATGVTAAWGVHSEGVAVVGGRIRGLVSAVHGPAPQRRTVEVRVFLPGCALWHRMARGRVGGRVPVLPGSLFPGVFLVRRSQTHTRF